MGLKMLAISSLTNFTDLQTHISLYGILIRLGFKWPLIWKYKQKMHWSIPSDNTGLLLSQSTLPIVPSRPANVPCPPHASFQNVPCSSVARWVFKRPLFDKCGLLERPVVFKILVWSFLKKWSFSGLLGKSLVFWKICVLLGLFLVFCYLKCGLLGLLENWVSPKF